MKTRYLRFDSKLKITFKRKSLDLLRLSLVLNYYYHSFVKVLLRWSSQIGQ